MPPYGGIFNLNQVNNMPLVSYVPISPDDAAQAKLTVTTLGNTAGGSKLVIAWGAMVGDLHTCVNIAGAWSNWSRISSPMPVDANEGDVLTYREGKWIAAPLSSIS